MKIISNVSQTILCPYQILADACVPLASSCPEPTSFTAINSLLFEQVCPLDTPTDWVNLDDSVGDLTAMRAFELTNMLLSILKANSIEKLDYHILLGAQTLTIDNIFLLIYLSDASLHLSIHVYADTEQQQLLKDALIPLKGKAKTVINYQSTDDFFRQTEFSDNLNKIDLNRQTLLQHHNVSFIDETSQQIHVNTSNHGNVLYYAWRCLKAGAYPLACRVLEMILAQATLPQNIHETIFLQLQAIRFLSHQHHLVTNDIFPAQFDTIDDSKVAYLYFIKAFSATMTRNLAIAKTCFSQANIDINMVMSDEDSLYKLNLYALFLVLEGQADAAYKLENQLLNYINQHYPAAVAINHVIRMNIARLYKKNKQFDESQAAYQQAYAQLAGGGFTLFDKMNFEMDKAILHEARGDMAPACLAWLKVALYWFACPNPYALAVRPRLILGQEKVVDTINPLSLEKVHQFLFNKLTLLSASSTEPDEIDELYDFISDTHQAHAHKTCHIINGLVVYSYDKFRNEHTKIYTESERNLRRLVTRLIKKALCMSNAIKAIAIDTLSDSSIPDSQQAGIAHAYMADCNDCYFHGNYINLNEPNSTSALDNITLKLPAMLTNIELSPNHVKLYYKRSFLNKTITDAKIMSIIQQLKTGQPLSALKLKQASPALFSYLIKHKIITIDIRSGQSINPGRVSVRHDSVAL